MTRLSVLGAVTATEALGTMGIGGVWQRGNDFSATETQARSLAVEFFQSQNDRRYEDTCGLLSRGFFKSHGLRDRQTCSAVMRVVFAWSGRIDFRIGEVTRE